MTLAALSHRRGAGTTPAANTVTAILDAVYTELTAANDYSATAYPSPLTGVTKFTVAGPLTEAVYGSFTTSAKTFKFLIAGSNAAKTPLVSNSTSGSHTWLVNCIMAGGTMSAGAFATWDHATQPFTSGTPIGLNRAFDTAGATAAKVYAVITAETLHVYIESSTGTIYGMAFGALVDPESTGALSAESDGRAYGVAVSGTTAMATTQHGTTPGSMWRHVALNGREHFLTVTPSTGAVRRTTRLDTQVVATTTSHTTADNEPIAAAMLCYDSTGGGFVGRVREVCITRDAKFAQRNSPAGVDKWHYISGSVGTDADAFALVV